MSQQQHSDDFWADDHLERQQEAAYLTHYLAARYQAKAKEEGFVLALNADWGMGKSFMIDRWSKDMEVAGHPVVSFDAWENDFTAEPLVAFIAELDKALDPYFSKIPAGTHLRQEWLEQAKAALVPCLKVAGFALVKHAAGMGAEQVTNLFHSYQGDSFAADEEAADKRGFDEKDLKEKLARAVEESLKSHNNTKVAISAFKKRLGILIEHLAKESDIQLPVCVFIDELDRCRPDYAIRLLEGVKHLFGVPGIHFIVATNLIELSHSVRAVYGSGFSADRYLKRFFDMEYSLPEPDNQKFAAELMTPFAAITRARFLTGFESIFESSDLPAKGLVYIFSISAVAFELTLRDQQQVSRIIEAALLSLGDATIHIHFLVFLAMLYQKNSQVYRTVARAKNLTEATGFFTVYPRNGTGFRIPRTDSSGGYDVISPMDVATLYFEALDPNGYRSRAASASFPANLHYEITQTQLGGVVVSNYIDIVRRAGRFSK